MPSDTSIRRAVAADSPELTRMVRESKAYIGEYQPMVQGLTISPEQIARDLVYVYERDNQLLGFYSLIEKGADAELDFMFVDNHAIGTGIGRQLFLHMLNEARRHGYMEVLIVAHPPAEAFYARMGARTVALQPPAGRVTWARPRMVVSTHLPEQLIADDERTEDRLEHS
jgi:N-acetylglutamate synthase-like GNAT family acetyltransferase